ncbi:acyltransferase family protein [Erythrobacter sp. Alg231-14]|uniref:acyltransferase family protein n=1 Tax=Erythrobacter sp. Alg231-14 TaxID=1922225 RepID=UPI000D561A5F
MSSAASNTKMIDHLAGRDNNLNLIRVIAASAVLVSHAFPIALGAGAVEPFDHIAGKSLGWLAVAIFFSLSGLLIANSFDRGNGWARFVVARALRLFPALVVVLSLTVIVGAAFTTLPILAYFGSTETLSYIPRNLSLAFLQYPLPGVFDSNIYPNAINGSLWTLFYEVGCYTLLFIAGVMGVLRYKWLVSALVATLGLAFIYCLFIEPPAGPIAMRIYTLISLGFPFSLGVLVFVWRAKFAFDGRTALILWVVCAFALNTVLTPFFFLIALTYSVGWFGFVPKGHWLRYNRVGDYSYGIYIYAFPVQQMMSALFPDAGPYGNMALSIPPTFILAILSWHLIEERALAQIKPLAAKLQKAPPKPASV